MQRVLALVALTLLATGAARAQDPAPTPWPVSVARDGFTADQAARVLGQFAPQQLATGGNQALYAYLNMAQFFPHQVTPRAGGIRVMPRRAHPELVSVRVETALGHLTLDALMNDPRSRMQGLLVIHHGDIVFERYPGMREDDSHLWWSVAKVLAGVLTELLIDEGQLERDRNVVAYLPELKSSGWDGVRVGQVLDMTSGIAALDSAEAYVDPDSGIGGLIHAEGILQAPAGYAAIGHDQALRRMRSAREPGTAYGYSSANTNVLALLIEHATGQRFGEVVTRRIWSRIGAEGDGLLGLTPDGRAIAHGMFSSRLRDLGRLGLLFTPSGHDESVLPRRVLERITDSGRNQAYLNTPAAATAAQRRLGERPVNALAQWDALFADSDLFKSGFDGQALYVSPARDVVIAMYATSKDKSAYAYLREIAARFPVNAARD